MNGLPPDAMAPDRPIEVRHEQVKESGVYLGLDEEAYHAALALSASGIKSLRISTLDWYMRSPLSPLPADDEESEARLIGRAYHRRICEGRAAFDESYGAAIDPVQYQRVRCAPTMNSARRSNTPAARSRRCGGCARRG